MHGRRLFLVAAAWTGFAHAFTDFRIFDEYARDRAQEASPAAAPRGLLEPRAVPGRDLFPTASWAYGESQVRAGYAYSNSDPVRLLETGATTNPLLHGLGGLQSAPGQWGYVGNRTYLRFFDLFEVQTDVDFRPRENAEPGQSDSFFFARELYAGLRVGALQAQAGKIRTTWGVGRINHVLFSDENEPMWMVRLTNAEPVRLPWILRFLGPTRFEAFGAFLDESQTFPNGYLVGAYFAFAPTKRFEFGVGQTILFGGRGAPTNDPTVIASEGFVDVDNPGNRNFLFSARYRIPGLEIEPYVEWLLEDCCPKFPGRFFAPRNSTHQLGVFFPQVGPEALRTDLAFEWFRSSHIAYRHQEYRTGYVYRGKLLGPTFGPEGTGVSLRLRHAANPTTRLYVEYAHELRGKLAQAISFGDDIPITDVDPAYETAEERNRIEVGCERKIGGFELIGGIGADRSNHESYVRYEANRYHWFGTLAVRRSL